MCLQRISGQMGQTEEDKDIIPKNVDSLIWSWLSGFFLCHAACMGQFVYRIIMLESY